MSLLLILIFAAGPALFGMNTAYAADQDGMNGDSELANPYIKRYPFDSVVIRYSGKTEYGHAGTKKKSYEGNEVLYIEGDKLAKTVSMIIPSSDGETKQIERLQIITPDDVYFIDLVENSGKKIENSYKFVKPKYEKLSKEEKKAFHERMDVRGIVSLDLSGLGKKTGTDVVLGKQCDIYEFGEKPTEESFMNAVQAGMEPPYYRKTWIWRDAKIPLKMVTEQFLSQSELTATSIEENVDIPEQRFEAPEGVKVAFDNTQSQASKEEALARFRLYKTGKPILYKVKVQEEKVSKNDKDKTKK